MKYYATLTTPKGEKFDLSDKINGRGHFFSGNLRLKGDLESNATQIICKNNQLTSLNTPNVILLDCSNNQLPSINTPNVINLSCDNNLLTNINAPNVINLSCDNNPLKALVKDCGRGKRQIWSQKVDDVIYTYIGCGRFTLKEAIAAINKEYLGKDAADYIENVKISQSMVE